MTTWRHGRASSFRAAAFALIGCAALAAASCGKKGPPLPPLRLVPAAPADVSARRTASEVELRFTLPTRNQNGPGPIALDRIEVYAVTLPPGAPTVANRDLLTRDRLVGTIPVKPPPDDEEPAAEDPSDKRPAPGARAVFVEELTEARLTPIPLPKESAPEGTLAAPAAPVKAPDYPARVYALRGVTRSGRAGPAQRVAVPLVEPPSPPGSIEVAFTERTFQLAWIPPVDEAGGLSFNVYAGASERIPLNPSPLTAAAFEHGPVQFGEERCFVVRSVRTVQGVAIESGPSAPQCVSPRDIFAPAAPQGLQVVAAPEGISLSWNANTEEDLAGYVVLRGEAPGDTLRPLTPAPIREPNYRDTAVQPGVRYVYALVAVDNATPPNTSAQSQRQEATAR